MAESTERAGDYDTAEQLLYEAVHAGIELGAQGHVASFFESLAGVFVEQHRVEQAIRVLAAVDAHRTDRGLPLNTPERRLVESVITKARTEAGPIRFGLAWAGGQALTLTQIVREVLRPNQESSQQEPATAQQIPSAQNELTVTAVSGAPWL